MPRRARQVSPDVELETWVNDTTNREHECRRYLEYATNLLFRDTLVALVYKEIEYRGHAGDSDYVISGRVREESGVECVRAYVWELKAPQCYIFQSDTNNRLRPSKHLVQAENQLLHYFYELKNSGAFRQQFGVSDPDNVCLGGIIIGCNRRRVHGRYDEQRKSELYRIATKTRRYLYDSVGIRLMTWDHILDHLRPPT